MDDRWLDRLSEYLDGELELSERAALEAHLLECGRCSGTLEELRAVVRAAAGVEDSSPAADLWPGIERRLALAGASGAAVFPIASRRRRFSFSLPQLAAAGVALVAVSSALVWTVLTRTPAPVASRPVSTVVRPGPVAAAPSTPAAVATSGADERAGAASPDAAAPSAGEAPSAPAPVMGSARLVRAGGSTSAQASARAYDQAVSELEAVLRRERSTLRPETVGVLRKSLADIDRAIAQARRALARDPASLYLNDHLAESMRLKLELLRQATALTQS